MSSTVSTLQYHPAELHPLSGKGQQFRGGPRMPGSGGRTQERVCLSCSPHPLSYTNHQAVVHEMTVSSATPTPWLSKAWCSSQPNPPERKAADPPLALEIYARRSDLHLVESNQQQVLLGKTPCGGNGTCHSKFRGPIVTG